MLCLVTITILEKAEMIIFSAKGCDQKRLAVILFLYEMEIPKKIKLPEREVWIYQIWTELCPNTSPQYPVRNGGMQQHLIHFTEDIHLDQSMTVKMAQLPQLMLSQLCLVANPSLALSPVSLANLRKTKEPFLGGKQGATYRRAYRHAILQGCPLAGRQCPPSLNSNRF